MKLIFLGTGTSQGVPVIACNCETCASQDAKDKRLRSSVYLETEGLSLVIDTGPDFRQQMLREKIHKLDAVLFTHEHKDHTAGLDDVRAFNFIQNRPMDVYAVARVQKIIKKEFNYAFAIIKYPGVPEINRHIITKKPFRINSVEIIPIEGVHYFLKVMGYRIGRMAYLTDISSISDREKTKLQNLEVLIVNALRKKRHYSHFNLEQALNLINEVKPRRAYLTHISHMMGKHAEVEKELPDHVKFAYDGLEIII